VISASESLTAGAFAEQYLKKYGESGATLEDPSWVNTKADKGEASPNLHYDAHFLFKPHL
jgi:hypothetical protein